MCNWIDLMAGSSKGSYNIAFAHAFGLQAAVYLEALLDVMVQVKRKGTYRQDGTFVLDRDYVRERTTLTADVQAECDKAFAKAGFLQLDPLDPNRIGIMMSKLMQTMIGGKLSDVAPVPEVAKPKRVRDPEAKKRGMVSNLVNHMLELEADEDLRREYADWIKSCVEQKTLNKIAVEHFIADVSGYSQDKQVRIREIRRHAEKAYNKFYAPTPSVFPNVAAAKKTVEEKPLDVDFDTVY